MVLISLGAAVGTEVVENSWFEERLDTSDEWIRQRTGIARRRVLAAGASFHELCAVAAERACVGLMKNNGPLVDVVILATTTPEDDFGDAARLAGYLEARGLAVPHCAALDLRTACCGFVDAVQVGARFTGDHDRVLVVAADCLSRRVDATDRAVAPLFGDAACAAILAKKYGALAGASMRTFETDALTLLRRRKGHDPAPSPELIDMRGREVFDLACAKAPEAIRALLAEVGWTVVETHIILHQANARIVRAVQRTLEAPRVPCHTSNLGNTGAASVGLMLAHLALAGRLRPGDRVLLCGFGAGFRVSCCAFEWARDVRTVGGGGGGGGAGDLRLSFGGGGGPRHPSASFPFEPSDFAFDDLNFAEVVIEEGRREATSVVEVVAAAVRATLDVGDAQSFEPSLVDSLSAMEFAARLRQTLKRAVSPTLLLEAGSLEDLVIAVEALRRDEPFPSRVDEEEEVVSAAEAVPRILDDGDTLWYAVTALQHAMLFHHAAEPFAGHFVESFVWRLADNSGGGDATALRGGVRHALRRHGALRSVFDPLHRSGGTWTTPTQCEVPFDEAMVDAAWDHVVSYEDGAAVRTRVARRQREDILGALGGQRPPLIRVALVEGAAGDRSLLLCVHHLVCDGASMRVILDDLAHHHSSQAQGGGGGGGLAAPAWRDLAVEINRAAADGAALAAAVEYFKKIATEASLTTTTSRPNKKMLLDSILKGGSGSSAVVSRAQERRLLGVVAPLQAVARQSTKGSLGAVVHAAFALAVLEVEEEPDAPVLYAATLNTRGFYTSVAAQDGAASMKMTTAVGPALNTVPILVDRRGLSRATPFALAARRVGAAVALAIKTCATAPWSAVTSGARRKVDVVLDVQSENPNWVAAPALGLSEGVLRDRAGVAVSLRCIRDGDDLILGACAERGAVEGPLNELVSRLGRCLEALAASVDTDIVGDLPLGVLRHVALTSSPSDHHHYSRHDGSSSPLLDDDLDGTPSMMMMMMMMPEKSAPSSPEGAAAATASAASEATMRAIAAAVAAELGVEGGPDALDRDANLIALGLDSLGAMRALAAAVACHGAPATLSLSHLFAHPTVRAVAAAADDSDGALRGDASPRGGPPAGENYERLGCNVAASPFELIDEDDDDDDEDDTYPLFGVGAAHFVGLHASSFSSGAVAPQIYWEWQFEGALDVARFEGAWDAVIARHPTLRATVQRDGTMRVGGQRVGHAKAQRVRWGASAVDEARRDLQDEASGIGSVYEWPLFAFQVSHGANAAGSVAHVAMSLFLMDAVSDLTFRAELSRAYVQLGTRTTTTPPSDDAVLLFDTPAPALRFGRYARSLVARLHRSAEYARAKAFWTARVETMAPKGPGLPRLPPTGKALVTASFKNATVHLAAEAWRRGVAETARRGATVPVALLAAYCCALARHLEEPAAANRRFLVNVLLCLRYPAHEDAFRVIGNCSSNIVVDVDLRAARSFADACGAVAAALATSLEHSAMTGIEVVELLKRRRHRDGEATRSFEALTPFVFTTPLGVEHTLPDARDRGRDWCFRETHFSERVPHTVCVNAIKDDPATGAAAASLDYLQGVFPEAVTDALAQTYRFLLEEVLCGGEQGGERWDADVFGLLDARKRRTALPPPVDDDDGGPTTTTNVATPSSSSDRLLQDALFDYRGEARRPALICDEDGNAKGALREMCYFELRSRSRAAAAALEALLFSSGRSGPAVEATPAGHHRFVGAIVMAKGWRQVVAAHAILACGGAYVPVDALLWPEQRCRDVVARSGADVVLVDDDAGPSLKRNRVDQKGWGVATLAIADFERDQPELAWIAKSGASDHHGDDDNNSDPVSQRRSPASAAYIIYTSGSTGRPKGVVCHHAGALNTIADCNARSRVGAEDRILGLSSLAFDLSVYDIFGATMAGAALVLPRPSDVSPPEPRRWVALARRAAVTLWNSVPALLDLACVALEMNAGAANNKDNHHYHHHHPESCSFAPSLRTFWLSGDAVPPALPARCARLCSQAPRIVLMGGATEAAIWSNEHVVSPRFEPPRGWSTYPYGNGLSGQTLEVLDDATLETAEPWAVGGIYIGGAGVATGYHNDPDRTTRQFITRRRDGARFLRTGDLGRLRGCDEHPSGLAIEILGRSDAQVKVRGGFRVDLGEVEHAVVAASQNRILAAAADARDGDLVVHATTPTPVIIMARSPASPPQGDEWGESFESELRARLAAILPSYMVPRRVVPIAELPLSSNGKLDRKRLPKLERKKKKKPTTEDREQPSLAAEEGGPAFVAPRDATEGAVQRAFADVLHLEDRTLSISSDFFRLGGTSMTALRLLLGLNKQFKTDLTARTLLEAPTIAKLAAAILLKEDARRDTDDNDDDGYEKASPGRLLHQRVYESLDLAFAAAAASGEGTVLVLVNPAGASGLCYLSLARAVARASKETIRVVALDDGVVAGRIEALPFATVRDAAADAAAAVQGLFFSGPPGQGPRRPSRVILGGWSYGGVVAMEAARLLAERSCPTDGIVLFDAPLTASVVTEGPNNDSEGMPPTTSMAASDDHFAAATRNLATFNRDGGAAPLPSTMTGPRVCEFVPDSQTSRAAALALKHLDVHVLRGATHWTILDDEAHVARILVDWCEPVE